ncbi:hypothetical protein BpHYR1_034166 [Brachionus plicatilis]|uniref:Uncharacterized protein n=1 Tax=Brachionus plicatilis TaxID=10195 RepID=A0A3M7QQL8_BRAPC|nr:hypothetical protein BpHYR1_034166 [Brachionus plicatilis]
MNRKRGKKEIMTGTKISQINIFSPISKINNFFFQWTQSSRMIFYLTFVLNFLKEYRNFQGLTLNGPR